MFGSTEKFENHSELKKLRSGLFYLIALCAALMIAFFMTMGSAASAQNAVKNQVSLTSEVFVMRTEANADGIEKEVLKTPNDVVVIPGDRLKFILSYKNETGQIVDGFKAINPMPGAVRFAQASEDWAEVSVDGGISWGKLNDLTIETKDPESEAIVRRAAAAIDVTHVRWVFNGSIDVNVSGTLSFEGVVK